MPLNHNFLRLTCIDVSPDHPRQTSIGKSLSSIPLQDESKIQKISITFIVTSTTTSLITQKNFTSQVSSPLVHQSNFNLSNTIVGISSSKDLKLPTPSSTTYN